MSYIKEKGFEARAFYLNVLYLIMVVLASITAGTLNAPYEYTRNVIVDGHLSNISETVSAPLYRRCFLNGTEVDFSSTGCNRITGTEDNDGLFKPTVGDEWKTTTMDTIFNISIATAVVNALLLTHSIIMHFSTKFGISLHFKFQWMFSLINIGLFSGLLGWMNSIDELQSKANLEHNIFFQDVNVFAIAICGVVLSVIDTVASNMVVYVLCTASKGYMCTVEDK